MIALQLHSVRDKLFSYFAGTLEAVANMGYEGVEFAGFGDLSADEVKELLVKNNLKVVGSHTGIDQISDNLDGLIAYNKTIGNKNIVIPAAELKTQADIDNFAKIVNSAEPKLCENGLTIFFHNHDSEFNKIGDKTILDLLFDACPNMKSELDVCWAHVAGVNPAEYIKQNIGRTSLLHLKSYHLVDGDVVFDDISGGIVDIKEVVSVAKSLGITTMIVENDSPQIDCLEDVKHSVNYYKTLN